MRYKIRLFLKNLMSLNIFSIKSLKGFKEFLEISIAF